MLTDSLILTNNIDSTWTKNHLVLPLLNTLSAQFQHHLQPEIIKTWSFEMQYVTSNFICNSIRNNEIMVSCHNDICLINLLLWVNLHLINYDQQVKLNKRFMMTNILSDIKCWCNFFIIDKKWYVWCPNWPDDRAFEGPCICDWSSWSNKVVLQSVSHSHSSAESKIAQLF